MSPIAADNTFTRPQNKDQNSSFDPTGAYVTLKQLQQLRHIAKQCKMRSPQSKASAGGGHRSRAVSRGMEFEEVRQYQAGDDIRNIDWRVTARTQITHSKRFQEEKELPIITAVDQRSTMFFGSRPCFKSVYACHLAALINWATLSNGDRSGGLVLSANGIDETRPARSHKTVNRWLQQLSHANQALSAHTSTTSANMQDMLQQLHSTAHAGTSIYLISDFYDLDSECESWLFQLARHHRLTLIWVIDPLEAKLPNASSVTISDGKNSTELAVHRQTQTQFQQRFLEKQERLTQLSQRYKLRLLPAYVNSSPIDVIRQCIN